MAGANLLTWARVRVLLALFVAAAADSVFLWTEVIPPLAWALDLGVAFALFLLIGPRWVLLPALFLEALPATAVLPSWLLVVASLGILPGGKGAGEKGVERRG